MGSAASRSRARSDRELHEFLPGVLAVSECAPSPAAGRVFWLIMALLGGVLLWAFVGRVDIVAVATGRVIPSGLSKPVQSQVTGKVRAIHVSEGQRVEAGALLVALDPVVSEAEAATLREQLGYLQTVESRIRRLLEVTADRQGRSADVGLRAAPAALGDDLQGRLLQTQVTEYRQRMEALEQGLGSRAQSLKRVQSGVARYSRLLPLVSERAEGIRRLTEQKLQGRHAWLEIEQQRIDMEQSLAEQRLRVDEVRADLARLRAERSALEVETRRQWLEQLADAKQRIRTLTLELVKAEEQLDRQSIRAPVSGVVQQLAVRAPGAVVGAGERLMMIVPDGEKLQVEALLANRDIGFVRVGQRAAIKVETFQFTRYGTINATLSSISGDALPDEHGALSYMIRLAFDRPRIKVEGRWLPLGPGMRVVAEVHTGQRRIIDYLLGPLLRYRDESLRER